MRFSKMLFFLCFSPTIKFQDGSPVDPLFEPPANPRPLLSRKTGFGPFSLFFRGFFVTFSWLFRGPCFGQILRVLALEQSSDFCSTEKSMFRGREKGEKAPRKGEEEGWPTKGVKRKKGRMKPGQ